MSKSKAPTDNTVGNQNLKPFKPGQSGNPKGRPPGARNKLCGEFISDLHEHYLKNGMKAIEAVFKKSPTRYLTIIAELIPKEFDLGEKSMNGFAEFLAAIDAGKVPLPPTPKGEGVDD